MVKKKKKTNQNFDSSIRSRVYKGCVYIVDIWIQTDRDRDRYRERRGEREIWPQSEENTNITLYIILNYNMISKIENLGLCGGEY